MTNNRRKMNELASKLGTMYLTENPININDEHFGDKYFICFHNTHAIVKSFRNIPNTIEFLEDVIKNGFEVGAGIFY